MQLIRRGFQVCVILWSFLTFSTCWAKDRTHVISMASSQDIELIYAQSNLNRKGRKYNANGIWNRTYLGSYVSSAHNISAACLRNHQDSGFTSPTETNAVLLVTQDGVVGAVNGTDGSLIWRQALFDTWSLWRITSSTVVQAINFDERDDNHYSDYLLLLADEMSENGITQTGDQRVYLINICAGVVLPWFQRFLLDESGKSMSWERSPYNPIGFVPAKSGSKLHILFSSSSSIKLRSLILPVDRHELSRDCTKVKDNRAHLEPFFKSLFSRDTDFGSHQLVALIAYHLWVKTNVNEEKLFPKTGLKVHDEDGTVHVEGNVACYIQHAFTEGETASALQCIRLGSDDVITSYTYLSRPQFHIDELTCDLNQWKPRILSLSAGNVAIIEWISHAAPWCIFRSKVSIEVVTTNGKRQLSLKLVKTSRRVDKYAVLSLGDEMFQSTHLIAIPALRISGKSKSSSLTHFVWGICEVPVTENDQSKSSICIMKAESGDMYSLKIRTDISVTRLTSVEVKWVRYDGLGSSQHALVYTPNQQRHRVRSDVITLIETKIGYIYALQTGKEGSVLWRQDVCGNLRKYGVYEHFTLVPKSSRLVRIIPDASVSVQLEKNSRIVENTCSLYEDMVLVVRCSASKLSETKLAVIDLITGERIPIRTHVSTMEDSALIAHSSDASLITWIPSKLPHVLAVLILNSNIRMSATSYSLYSLSCHSSPKSESERRYSTNCNEMGLVELTQRRKDGFQTNGENFENDTSFIIPLLRKMLAIAPESFKEDLFLSNTFRTLNHSIESTPQYLVGYHLRVKPISTSPNSISHSSLVELKPIWRVRFESYPNELEADNTRIDRGKNISTELITVDPQNSTQYLFTDAFRTIFPGKNSFSSNHREIHIKHSLATVIVFATLNYRSEHEFSELRILFIDGLTGSSLGSVVHENARGPVHLTVADHVAVYIYTDTKQYTSAIGVTELLHPVKLYKNSRSSTIMDPNSTDLWTLILCVCRSMLYGDISNVPKIQTSLMPTLRTSVSLLSYDQPIALGVTHTMRGISNKHVLLATLRGSVVALDLHSFLIVSISDQTDSAQYSIARNLIFQPLQFVTQTQVLRNIRGIATEAQYMESSVHVIMYGRDIMYRVWYPSSRYDILNDSVNFRMLIGLLAGGVVLLIVLWKIARLRSHKMGWS